MSKFYNLSENFKILNLVGYESEAPPTTYTRQLKKATRFKILSVWCNIDTICVEKTKFSKYINLNYFSSEF